MRAALDMVTPVFIVLLLCKCLGISHAHQMTRRGEYYNTKLSRAERVAGVCNHRSPQPDKSGRALRRPRAPCTVTFVPSNDRSRKALKWFGDLKISRSASLNLVRAS